MADDQENPNTALPQEQPVAAPAPIQEDPGIIQQVVNFAKQKWDEGGQNIHNTLEAAKQGNYAPIQQMAVNTALSTVGSTAPVAAEMEAMGLAMNSPGILGRVTTKLGIPAGTPPQEALKIVSNAFEQGLLTPAEVQGATNALRGVQPIKGFADGGEVADTAATPEGTELFDVSGQQPVLGTVPHDQVTDAVASGQYSFPQGKQIDVINPDGEHGTIPPEQASQAFQAGYRFFTPGDARTEKYSGAAQGTKAFLEGAAEGVAGPLATAAETGLGIASKEDILGRREERSGLHTAGQVTGFGGSMLTGIGEAGLLAKAGEAGAAAVGLGALEGVGVAARIGSQAVKSSIEMGLLQGQDEASRAILQDPNQSVQTAVTDVGLSALLGGAGGAAVGSVSPLWQAAMGTKTGQILKSITDHMGGVEGSVPEVVTNAAEKAGLELSPEIRAAASDNPHIQEMFNTLNQSDTTAAGKALQESAKEFRGQASEAIASSLGKTAEEVNNLEHLSEYESGQNVKRSLTQQLKETIDPISQQFDKIKDKFKGVELSPDAKTGIAEEIAKVSAEKGYTLSASAPGTRIIHDVLSEMPELKSLEDLRKYQSIIGEKTTEKGLWQLGKDLKGIFRNAEEGIIQNTLGQEAPELLEAHAAARGAYAKAMETVDALNDRLRVGRYSGPSSFIKALSDMAPEDVLRRLSPKGDAALIQELSSKFPKVAEQVKDYHLSQLLKTASAKAGEGQVLNPKAVFASLDKMSPEMKSFVVPPGGEQKIQAVKELLEHFDNMPHNFSNTARTVDKLLQGIPGSASMFASLLTGHSGIASAIIGALTKTITKDVPDAVRLGLLKFLGSNQELSPSAFKAAVEMIQATIKGNNLVGKGTKALFKSGAEVIPTSLIPSERDRKKLDDSLKEVQENPSKLLEQDNKTAHYMPEHGTAVAQVAATAAGYLNSQRPTQAKMAPLDPDVPPSSAQKAAWNRTLDIAQQPLMVLKHVKDGTLIPSDINTLKTIYPDLYNKMSKQMTDHMIEQGGKQEPIPYRTRISMSMFLGQALDSTMTPQAILAAQPKPPQTPQGAQGMKGEPKHATNALSKLPGMYQTPAQRSEAKNQMKS